MAITTVDFDKSATTQGRTVIGRIAMQLGRAARTGEDIPADTLAVASLALKSLARGASIGATHEAFLQDGVELGLFEEATGADA